MPWNKQYAACRYFRRRGDVINKPRRMVVFKRYPPQSATYAKHKETLANRGFHFFLDMFIDD